MLTLITVDLLKQSRRNVTNKYKAAVTLCQLHCTRPSCVLVTRQRHIDVSVINTIYSNCSMARPPPPQPSPDFWNSRRISAEKYMAGRNVPVSRICSAKSDVKILAGTCWGQLQISIWATEMIFWRSNCKNTTYFTVNQERNLDAGFMHSAVL